MNDPFVEQPDQLDRCAYCHDQCMSATPEVVASGKQTHVVSRVAAVGRMLDRGEMEWSPEAAAPFFYGLNDGWQREYCIFANEGQRVEPYLRRFRELARSRGFAPRRVADALSLARSSGNVFGLERVPLPVPMADGIALIHDAATRALTPGVVEAAHAVLAHAGAPSADLPVDSCGMAELDLGDRELARRAAQSVGDAVVMSRASLLVTTDAVLAYAMRFAYPFLGIEVAVPVLHLAEFVVDRILATRGAPVDVTFHDPAWLSRGLGVVDAPRRVLRRIEGVNLLEAASWGRDAASDGPLAGYPDPNVAAAIARDRLDELIDTGATIVVTASPYSQANIAEVARGSLEVVDLSEFLASRLELI